MRKDKGPARIKIAGEAGINFGHHPGQEPNQACPSGATPSIPCLINKRGE